MSTQLHGLIVQPRGRTPESQDSRRPRHPPRRSTPGIWRSAKNGQRPKKAPSSPPPPPNAAPGCQLHSPHCASPFLLHNRKVLRLGDELDLRHLHCRRDPCRCTQRACQRPCPDDDLHNRDVDQLEEFVLVQWLPLVEHLLLLFIFFFVSSFSFSSSNSSNLGSSQSKPSTSIVLFIFTRIGHCPLLRVFNVQHDGKADEF